MVGWGRGKKSGENVVVTKFLERGAVEGGRRGNQIFLNRLAPLGFFYAQRVSPQLLLQHVMNGVQILQCKQGGQVPKYPYLPYPLNPPAPDGTEPTPGDISGGAPDSFWDDQGETCGGAGGGDGYVPRVHGAEPTQPSISMLIPLRAGVNLKLRYTNTRGFFPLTPPLHSLILSQPAGLESSPEPGWMVNWLGGGDLPASDPDDEM